MYNKPTRCIKTLRVRVRCSTWKTKRKKDGTIVGIHNQICPSYHIKTNALSVFRWNEGEEKQSRDVQRNISLQCFRPLTCLLSVLALVFESPSNNTLDVSRLP